MANDLLPRLGFLGSGKMATALIRGLLRAGLTTPDRVAASDVLPSARAALAEAAGVATHADNAAVVADADVVVVAVKPQTVRDVLAEVRDHVTPQHLVVSIAAGVTIAQLAAHLPLATRTVRVMPNTPCLVGASASAYCLGPDATPGDQAIVERLLGAVGLAFALPENLFDAVTGLSASGPAFVAVTVEALGDGGVLAGLPRDVANLLAAQTVLGTAKMILDGPLHPAVLKEMVASPGGTTIAGLRELEKGGLRGALMDAVAAAARRARELGTS